MSSFSSSKIRAASKLSDDISISFSAYSIAPAIYPFARPVVPCAAREEYGAPALFPNMSERFSERRARHAQDPFERQIQVYNQEERNSDQKRK